MFLLSASLPAVTLLLKPSAATTWVFAQGADPVPSLYPSRSVISDIGVTMLPVGPRYPDVLTDPR